MHLGQRIWITTCSRSPHIKPYGVDVAVHRTFTHDRRAGYRGNSSALICRADNQPYKYKQGSTVLATYTYDGDGNLVKKVANGQTTVYVGPHYEKNLTTGVVTRYYYLGSQRVAMSGRGKLGLGQFRRRRNC
jgi:YD repeat-containing protein